MRLVFSTVLVVLPQAPTPKSKAAHGSHTTRLGVGVHGTLLLHPGARAWMCQPCTIADWERRRGAQAVCGALPRPCHIWREAGTPGWRRQQRVAVVHRPHRLHQELHHRQAPSGLGAAEGRGIGCTVFWHTGLLLQTARPAFFSLFSKGGTWFEEGKPSFLYFPQAIRGRAT